MKRDDDLIRAMLTEMEASAEPWTNLRAPMFGMEPGEIERWHHMQLLCDAGLATLDEPYGFRLTSQGHDFLAAIRDDGLWQRTKRTVAESGGSVPVQILKDLAVGYLRKQIRERTGIDL